MVRYEIAEDTYTSYVYTMGWDTYGTDYIKIDHTLHKALIQFLYNEIDENKKRPTNSVDLLGFISVSHFQTISVILVQTTTNL